MWVSGNGIIHLCFTGVFNNPAIGGVTIETPKVKPHPNKAGRGSFWVSETCMARKPWRWAGSRYGEGPGRPSRGSPMAKSQITTAERW